MTNCTKIRKPQIKQHTNDTQLHQALATTNQTYSGRMAASHMKTKKQKELTLLQTNYFH